MRTPIVTVQLLLPLVASADETFRCGKWIVASDLTVDDLQKKCGEPTDRKIDVQEIKVRNRDHNLMTSQGTTTIETWTSDRGPNAAPMVVTIIDGKIKSIDRQK